MKKILTKKVVRQENTVESYASWPCNCGCSCSCGSVVVPDATTYSQISSSNFAKNVNH